jgi:hypothetical protein
MRVDFPYIYEAKYRNSKQGTSTRKLLRTHPFDVAETTPDEVQVLMEWSAIFGGGDCIPGSCIRWNGYDFVSLNHVDPRSCVVRSDLPVGEEHQRGDPYRFLDLYDDIGDLSDNRYDLREYLAANIWRFASTEAPNTVSSTQAKVIQDITTMANGLLIVGEVVFQRIVGIHVRIHRSFTANASHAAYLYFTKFGANPFGETDINRPGLISKRLGDLKFSVAEYERSKRHISLNYVQLFCDLAVHDLLALPYDNERYLLKDTARAIVSQTAKDIGIFDAGTIESWLKLRDIVMRLDAGQYFPNALVIDSLDSFARNCKYQWIARMVTRCHDILGVYRLTKAEIGSELATYRPSRQA